MYHPHTKKNTCFMTCVKTWILCIRTNCFIFWTKSFLRALNSSSNHFRNLNKFDKINKSTSYFPSLQFKAKDLEIWWFFLIFSIHPRGILSVKLEIREVMTSKNDYLLSWIDIMYLDFGLVLHFCYILLEVKSSLSYGHGTST